LRWGNERQLSCPSSTSAWYPTVEYMPDGKIVAAWSSRSNNRITIETETIAYAGDFDFDGDIDVDNLETLVAQWLQPPTEPSADIAPYKAGDDFVNMLDFAFLAGNWLWSIE